MKRTTLVGLMVLTVGCTAGLLAGAGPSRPHTTQWEYAVYRSWHQWHQWQTPDTDISIRGLPEFLKAVGLKDAKTERTVEMELANHFGSQGWELTEIAPPGQNQTMWSASM